MTTGTITKAISAGTLDYTTCKKVGHVVSVSGRIHTGTFTAAGVFFNIPEGFRPSANVVGIGYINVNNVGNVCVFANIFSNGEVRIDYSAGSTATQVGFTATYAVE